MSLVIDLMRHGEPVGGRRYRGQIDDPLSEKGWAQMWGAVAGASPWTRVVSSPLMRCRAFAEALAAQHGMPLEFDTRLMEGGFGEWEGHSAAEIEAASPGAVARFKADPVGARPAGAEPLEDFHARVTAALDELVARHASEHLLVVGHAGVMRMALAWALHMPAAHAYRIDVAPATLTRLRIDSAGARLIFHGNPRAES